MRSVGTHKQVTASSAPFVCVFIYDDLTKDPVAAWAQEGDDDIAVVQIGTHRMEVAHILDSVSITSARPQSGGGMRRATAKLSFCSSVDGNSPLVAPPIQKKFYHGGQNFDSLYFSVYSTDRVATAEDIKSGAHYGVFKLESDVSWSEEDGMHEVELIDAFLAQDQVVGAVEDQPLPDVFLSYNPWFNATIMPKVYGQIPRVRLLNSYPSFDIKGDITGVTGQVRSDYTSSSTTIILENNAQRGGMLVQLAKYLTDYGGIARVMMADKEVIAGTLAHDTVNNRVVLTVTARNTYYAKVGAYADTFDNKPPSEWRGGPSGLPPSYSTIQYSETQTVIPNADKVVLDANGYMQADIWFYRPYPNPQYGELVTNRTVKLRGLISGRPNVISHDQWRDPSHSQAYKSFSTISTFYNATDNSGYSAPGTNIMWGADPFKWMKFFNTPREARLFFVDPTTFVVGGGSVGAAWQLVGIEPAASPAYTSYIRNGYSKFDAGRVYCEGDGRLIRIPNSMVTSVTQRVTEFDMTDLCEIRLTAPPTELGIGAVNNTVYADALYATETNDLNASRTDKILGEIIRQEAPKLAQLLRGNLAPRTEIVLQADKNWTPFIGCLVNREMSLTELVDKICYQTGTAISWDRGGASLVGVAMYLDDPTITVAAQDYWAPPYDVLNNSTILENSTKVSIGKLRTSITEDGDEYLDMHYTATYGGWEDPNFPIVKPTVNRAIKPNQRQVEYHFDLINDMVSFGLGIGASLAIGHASGYTLSQRRLGARLHINECKWEAMDPVLVDEFPAISDGGTNVAYSDEGRMLIRKRTDNKFYIVGAQCVVESVTYNFDIRSPYVDLFMRTSQKRVDASGIHIYGPPDIPAGPILPPTDPNVAPPIGGNIDVVVDPGFEFIDDPMSFYLPRVPSITIDSTAAKTSEFDLVVRWDFLTTGGFTYKVWIDDEGDPQNYTCLLSDRGAQLSGDTSGAIPDKNPLDVVLPTPHLVLSVNYLWFAQKPLSTTYRGLRIMIKRTWRVYGKKVDGKSTATESSTDVLDVSVYRKDLTDVVGVEMP